MASRARKVVVVADSSKLGKHAFAQICPVSAVHQLITDAAADAAVVKAFEAEGVSVESV